MMNYYLKQNFLKTLAFASITTLIISCTSDDNDPTPEIKETKSVTKYFVGVEAATDPATDVLSNAEDFTSSTISPVNNGFEQPAWMSFFQSETKIFAAGYVSAPEFTSYTMVDGTLTKGDSFFTDLAIYASDVIDDSTLILMGSPREGLTEKKIYLVDSDKMEITKTVQTFVGDDETNNLLAFPVDMKVRGDKLFIAYYMISAAGGFSTPNANEAKVAVFSYPSLEFEKIITDTRAPNIGRYYSKNALEQDENGDIYTFSPSSLACGYAPVPETNSGILRIKNGETEFDSNYHIDFETLSGGYKINDLYYVANGKAVVRVIKEEETNEAFLWATYAPTGESPLLETGIVDLYNKTFTLLSNIPNGGGGWSGTYLVEDSKLFLGVSSSTYADIYIIDTETEKATKGATIDGNYAKALLSLTVEEEK